MMKTATTMFMVIGMMATTVACSTDTAISSEVVYDATLDQGTDVPVDQGSGDLASEACQRDCTGRVCGTDGCGGNCGICDDGNSCNPEGVCEVCTNPVTWGPIGMVATAAFSKDVAVIAAICADFNDDTKGDSALTAFADQLNPTLQAELDKGFYGAVAEFVGVTDWATTATFTLNAMAAGTGTPGGTELYVNPHFYNPATCQPYVTVADATMVGGRLTAGPRDLTMPYSFQGMDLVVTLNSAMITGSVVQSDDGISIADGVATGYITKDMTDAVVVQLKARCLAANPPDWCAQAGLFDLIPAAFDLDLDGDTVMDAASLCVQFTIKPAKILGYGVEN